MTGWQAPSLEALLAYVGRRTRRCGIHGDDTTNGRCASCDAQLAEGKVTR